MTAIPSAAANRLGRKAKRRRPAGNAIAAMRSVAASGAMRGIRNVRKRANPKPATNAIMIGLGRKSSRSRSRIRKTSPIVSGPSYNPEKSAGARIELNNPPRAPPTDMTT